MYGVKSFIMSFSGVEEEQFNSLPRTATPRHLLKKFFYRHFFFIAFSHYRSKTLRTRLMYRMSCFLCYGRYDVDVLRFMAT